MVFVICLNIRQLDTAEGLTNEYLTLIGYELAVKKFFIMNKYD